MANKKVEGNKIIIQPIILAAGESKRFKSNVSISKILAKIGNSTLLELQLQRVKGFLKPIVVARQEDKDDFQTVTRNRANIIIDKNPLNPTSSLIAALPSISQTATHVLIILGDTLCKSDNTIMVAKKLKSLCNSGVISISPSSFCNKSSTIVIIKNNKLKMAKSSKEKGKWRWAGLALLPIKFLGRLDTGGNLIFQISKLTKQGIIIKVIRENFCININTVSELEIAKKFLFQCHD